MPVNGWNRDERIRQSEMNRQRKTASDNIKDKKDANNDKRQLQVITGCRHGTILSWEPVTHKHTQTYYGRDVTRNNYHCIISLDSSVKTDKNPYRNDSTFRPSLP